MDSSHESSPEKYLLIDCDPGIDDCLALMMAFSQAPKVKTVAITCVNGNVGVEQVTLNAMRILKSCNMIEKVPVFRGCEEPILDLPESIDSSFYHGKDGLGDAPDAEPRADKKLLEHVQAEHAVNAIIRLSKEYEGKLQVLAIGPLTNLALAVKLDPTLPKRLQSLHVLGGTFRGHGNVTPSAEYNFFTDPEAASIVLRLYSDHCPIQLVTYEVTTDHAVPPDWFEKWLVHDDNPKRVFFNKVFQNPAKLEAEDIAQNISDGYIVCDAYLVCTALKPESVIKSKMVRVGVEVGGMLARGNLIIDHKQKGSPHLTKKCVEVVEKIDLSAYQDLLVKAFQ